LFMKYSHLIISGIPKSFELWKSVDSLQPIYEGMNLDDIQYDAYPAECDEEKGEDACVLFKYNESATGVYVVHTPYLQTLSLDLSPWAVEADVLLYASYINGILKRHKRARLYDKSASIEGLSDEQVQEMIAERKAYLKRHLAKESGFTMCGVNTGFTLAVEHLRPAISLDMQALELQQSFVRMQWEKGFL
jgi:hypothetical protein